MYTFKYITNFFIILYVVFSIINILIKSPSQNVRVTLFLILVLTLYIVMHDEFCILYRAESYINKNDIDIKSILCLFHSQTEKLPIRIEKIPVYEPVGGSWSYFINKKKPNGSILYTHKWKGMYPGGRWGSGTFIKDVQSILTSKGLTLFSHPSIENGTLGGWIASGSHGSGGTLWKSSFGKITVLDQKNSTVFETTPKKLFNDHQPIEESKNYIILDVEIIPHKNVDTKRILFKVFTEKDTEKFLNEDSYLRMLQIGQRGTMALMWIPLNEYNGEKYIKTERRLWFDSDILSILQDSSARCDSWFNFPTSLNSSIITSLSEANKFTPEPSFFTTPIGLLFYNFEVFVLNYRTKPNILLELCNRLSDTFTIIKIRGRCELRCGKTKLFLDFVVPRTTNTVYIFKCIKDVLGNVSIALHKGKAQVSTDPF